ncbi:MAG: saccharopine dehydrogenase NADP-binding domain-containing protein [Acidobacteriota bacterium]
MSDYDLVLFGATGFTGGLTAEYLARQAPDGVRWAIAGRSPEKLKRRADELAEIAGETPSILVASADDSKALRELAERTRVVITTVGPYDRYGEPLVEACVAGGADYVDITGEPQFVRRLMNRHGAAAESAGVRIVNCCGFDSIPHDLGALLAVQQLPPDEPMQVAGLVFGAGEFSGGTWHSAVNAMAQLRTTAKSVGSVRAPAGRRVRGSKRGVHYEKKVNAWAAPLMTIDPWIVLRSAGAIDSYGPDFKYGHYVRVRSLPKLAVGAAALTGVVAMAQLKPTRNLLLNLKKPGDGPSEGKRSRSRFEVVFLGTSAGGDTVRVEVSGGDPGYGETSKMLAESALCLIEDRDQLPQRHGILTPAMAFENLMIERLRRAEMRFEVMG